MSIVYITTSHTHRQSTLIHLRTYVYDDDDSDDYDNDETIPNINNNADKDHP
jgi:hypothetical protein